MAGPFFVWTCLIIVLKITYIRSPFENLTN